MSLPRARLTAVRALAVLLLAPRLPAAAGDSCGTPWAPWAGQLLVYGRDLLLLQGGPAHLRRPSLRKGMVGRPTRAANEPAGLLQIDVLAHVLGDDAATEPPTTTLVPDDARTQAPPESTEAPLEYPKYKYGEQIATYTTSEAPPMLEPIQKLSGSEAAAAEAGLEQKRLDCELSDWSDWSDCADDPSDGLVSWITTRERSVVNPQHEGGSPCPADLEMRKSCRYGAAEGEGLE